MNNFSKIAEKNPSLYQAYQSGDPSSLLEYYKENEKDKAKRKESVFRANSLFMFSKRAKDSFLHPDKTISFTIDISGKS